MPFCIVAGGLLCPFCGLFKAVSSFNISKKFANADGADSGEIGGQVQGMEVFYFFKRSFFQHGEEPFIATPVEFRAGDFYNLYVKTHAGVGDDAWDILPVGERFAGGNQYFQRADIALHVAFLQAHAHDGVFFLQCRSAFFLPHGKRLHPHFIGDIGNGGEAFHQRLYIKAGAAGDDGQFFLRQGFIDCVFCQREPFRYGTFFARWDDAVKGMRGGGFLFRHRPCGQDAQFLIYLHRIGIDDDAVVFLRYIDGLRRFTACGRATYNYYGSAHMKSVLTLIAASDKEKLTPPLIQAIAGELIQAGGLIIATDWLAEDIACDIIFSRIENALADKLAAKAVEGRAIDHVAQSTEDRQKKLLICDMDSTMITVECIDEIADFAGVKKQVSEITERAMRGEIDFPGALRERVGLLKGLPESVLKQVYDERIKYMPGGRELVKTMRMHGAYAILVSGGFDYFTAKVQSALGFNANSANRLEIEAGRLTGRVIEPILDKQAKLHTLMTVSSEKGIGLSHTLAVGDGANDLPMITAAGLGVAYHAKPLVQQSARARINYCDLKALLYIQGYKQNEIVN